MRPFYMISRAAIVPATNGNCIAMMSVATGTTYQRGYVTKVVVGSAAVAAASMTDDTNDYLITRLTAAVTGGTAIVPTPCDPSMPASALTGTAGAGCHYTSTGGTPSANGIVFGLNRRATYTFVANPGEEIGSLIAITSGVSLITTTLGTAGQNLSASMVFQE